MWPRQPKLKIVTLLPFNVAPNENETAQPSLTCAQPRVLLESARVRSVVGSLVLCSLARSLKCLLRAVLCPATTWINRWHTSLMRPNLNWNLLDSSWRYCKKAGRLREAREEGALWCQACGQEGGAGSGCGGSSWLRFQTATSEISISATWSTSFYNFDAAKFVWRLQLFPLDNSLLPNARIKLGEVGAHRASASQDDFWPRRRHSGGNRRAQKSSGKHASDGDNDVSSEGGSSDVNEEN